MTEIGPLLLPSPTAISGRAVAPARQAAGRQNAGEDSAYLATVDPTGDATAGGGRAKQFRFRVLDGGRSDTLGNAEVPARSQQSDAADDTRNARLGQERAGSETTGKSIPLGTFSAPFLAQLIAQEQLQPGLHDPPVKAADRAYRQAGGEPAWNGDAGATAHFQIAV